MRWINVQDRLPTKSGKYVVTTKTLTGQLVFKTNCFVDKNDTVTWGVNNQSVIKWLKEDEVTYTEDDMKRMAHAVHDYHESGDNLEVSLDTIINQNL